MTSAFQPHFAITNRMTQAITRIERARSDWHHFELGNFCDNFAILSRQQAVTKV